MNLRIFVPAVLCWGCVAWLIGHPGVAKPLMITLSVLGLSCWIAVMVLDSRPLSICFRALALTIGFTIILAARIDHGEWVRADPQVTQIDRGTFHITVVDYPSRAPNPQDERFWMRGTIEAERGRVPIMVWADGIPERHWGPGQQLQIAGRLTPQATSDVTAYGLRAEVITETGNSGLASVAANLRLTLTETAKSIPGADLVPGFAVGDTMLVHDALDRAMKSSSLTHLVAVSGANCALIVTAVTVLASYLRVGKRARILIAGGALGAFVFLVGPDASMQRAAVMATVALIAGFGGRKGVALPALGVAMMALLIADPWQARHAGFILSVAATSGILLISPVIQRWLQRLKFPQWFALPLSVTVAAQFMCGPFLLLLQPGLPAGGIVANMLAAPAAPLGTGLGLLALLVLPWHPGAGHVIIQLASVPCRWVEWLAFTTERLPLSRWFWPGGVTGALLLVLVQACVVVVLFILAHRRRAPWEAFASLPTVTRHVVWLSGAIGLGTLISVTVVTPVTTHIMTPKDWFLVMCDVGQGDAFLIRSPEEPERVMLTDTGDDPHLLRACLDRFGVSDITLLVLSHDDQDHTGALTEVLGEIKAAIVSPGVAGEEAPRIPLGQLEDATIPHIEGVAGMRGTLGGEGYVHWEILAPTGSERIMSTNAASIVMQVTVDQTQILMLGDTGRDAHARLLRAYPELRADVLKIAHHGSSDQDSRLLHQTDATVALISAGAQNRYGHPSETVLTELADTGARVFRTDTAGSVALSHDAGKISVWTER